MMLCIRKPDLFIADFDARFCWYDQQADWELACQYLDAVDTTWVKPAKLPDLGMLTRFEEPERHGLRFLPVVRPFHRHLIFFRSDAEDLDAWRLMHGARDLPRRLLEPSGTD